MLLISSREFRNTVRFQQNCIWFDSARIKTEWTEIKGKLASGESMIVIGTENFDVFKELEITGIRHELCGKSSFASLPVPGLENIKVNHGAALCPHYAMPYLSTTTRHNHRHFGIDEIIRADYIPLIDNYDNYGGYFASPAAIIRNKDSAMVTGNYKGSFWYFFGFEQPLEAINAEDWEKVISTIVAYNEKHCFMARFSCEFPTYREGECIRLEGRVENLSGVFKKLRIKIDVLDMEGNFITAANTIDRAVSGKDTLNFFTYFYPEVSNGLYLLRATLYEQDRLSYNEENEDVIFYLDTLDCGIVISDNSTISPVPVVEGTKIFIDGAADFFIGTHMYPTNNFYEMNFDSFQVHNAYKMACQMRKSGVRLCRVWVAPVIDETQLRGIEATLEIFAAFGIVMILTVFTQWPRYMYINLKGCHERVKLMYTYDYSFIGVCAKNMEGQLKIMKILGERFKGFSNLIWDLSNEYNIVNPKDEHVDEKWFGNSFKKLAPPYDGMEVFRIWATHLKNCLREANCMQLILYGNACWDGGCEGYTSTRDGDFIADHQYYALNVSACHTQLLNAACINKPTILEEFGLLTPDIYETAINLEHRLYYGLAAGHNAAITYEWGYAWRVEQIPYNNCDRRGFVDKPASEMNNFCKIGGYDYANSWIPGSTGLFPCEASGQYSINAPGTFNATPYIEATRRLKIIGRGLGYSPKDKEVYVVPPLEFQPFDFYLGYKRKVSAIFDTLNALWDNGVDYGIWQADCIATIPVTAKVVIYPNEDTIPKNMKEGLAALRRRGIAVFEGSDHSYLDVVSKMDAKSELPLQYLFRDTDLGRLCVMLNRDNCNELSKCNLDIYTAYPSGSVSCDLSIIEKRGKCHIGNIEFSASDYNLLLTDGDVLRLAQVYGELKLNGKLISNSDGNRYFIKAMDGESLENSRDILIGVYEPCKVTIANRFTNAQLFDEDRFVADFSLTYEGDHTVINFTGDEKSYTMRIKR